MDMQTDQKFDTGAFCVTNLDIYPSKFICKMSQRKYPEATDYAICSLIGGFFFLRFINPAIVTPQAYMLVEGVPAKHPRRTLTLVCRLQCFILFVMLTTKYEIDSENVAESS